MLPDNRSHGGTALCLVTFMNNKQKYPALPGTIEFHGTMHITNSIMLFFSYFEVDGTIKTSLVGPVERFPVVHLNASSEWVGWLCSKLQMYMNVVYFEYSLFFGDFPIAQMCSPSVST